MHILLTNDDGIYAPGILCLKEVLEEMGDLSVVAPISEQSAVGHSISLSHPLRVIEVERHGEFFGFGVSGAPADCVKLALCELLDRKPDIVVSGINLGANVAIDILYSGTVAAAIEGAIYGIPSVAVSLNMHDRPNFGPAAQFAKDIVNLVMKNGLPQGMLLNVNVPALAVEEMKGIKVTRQSSSRYTEEFDRRIDPHGKAYYWISGEMKVDEMEDQSDVRALQEGYISVTPLHYDLTSYDLISRVKEWQWGDGGV